MKNILFACLLSLGLSMYAFAEDVGVTIDGKKILVTGVGKHGDERILHSKDLHAGIYVVAVRSPFSSTIYPNATAIIRERFKASGFKVVDKAEGSAVGIQFFTNGALDLENADKAALASGLPTSSQVGVNAGALVAGIATGGVAAGVGFVMSAFLQSESKAVFNGFSLLKPLDNKMFKSDEKDAQFHENVIVHYKLEKENKASDDIVLKMITDQWINQYMVLDVEPVAASAVSTAATLAEVK